MTIVQSIALDRIDASDRLREVNGERAAAIAESMAVIGQQQPVVVRPLGSGFRLVSGGHRHAAVSLLGWSSIDAKVEELNDAQARLAEIDENLFRNELSPLDRAFFIAERKRVWEILHPEITHGGDRRSAKRATRDQVATVATRFTTDATASLNLTERTIQRSCFIASQLDPGVIDQVRRTYLFDHQGDLEKLARMPAEKQREAVQRLASGEVKTLAGAFGRTERNLEDKLFEGLWSLWSRCPAIVRRRFLGAIGVGPASVEAIVNPRGLKVAAAAE